MAPLARLLPLLLMSSFAHASQAYLPLPRAALEDGELRFGVSADYLKTSKNFTRDGGKANLTGDDNFQSFITSPFVQYGASDVVTLMADLQLVANQVTGTFGTNRTATNSSAGLGDGSLGLRYEANREPVRLLLDATIQFPLYGRLSSTQWSTFNSGSDVPRGEGATQLGVFASAELPVAHDTYLGAGVGYTHRTAGFSGVLPYQAYFKYQEPRAFFIRFGLTGQASVADDEFVNQAATSLPADRATAAIAGSQALNAINPSFIKADAMLGTYLGKMAFFGVGAQYPFAGKNVPQEPLFAAAVGFDFGGKQAAPTHARSNRGFLMYYLTSRVLVANNDLKQVLIDKGRNDGVKVGELLDLFEPDNKDGSFGATVARGRVLEAGPTRSKIQLLEYFKETTAEEGFVVRRPVR